MNTAAKFSAARVACPEPFEIKVPASIANLGPGFDTLAVAVQLYLRLCVRTVPGRGKLEFRFVGQHLCGENYIERPFRFLARQDSNSFIAFASAISSSETSMTNPLLCWTARSAFFHERGLPIRIAVAAA